MEKNKIFKIVVTLLVLVILTIIVNPIVVSAGNVGVKVTLGKVDDTVYKSGLYFYIPVISSIKEMDVRTIRKNGDAETYTKDIQQAKIQYVVNYHLDQLKASEVYRDIGEDWEEKIVPQAVESKIKSVIGTWEAVELIENRQKAVDDITEKLKVFLSERNIIVDSFQITNIDYTSDFEKAVEDKVTAIQKAAEAKNKTVQVQEEANQRIISAEAEAKSMRIRSEALSQNQNLVQYEAVQKWDGKLPTYMLGDSTPFINVKGE